MENLTIEQLAQNMLDNQNTICHDDLVYKQDIEELGGRLIVNWDFCEIKVYQIYNTDGCSGKVNEHLSDADILIKFLDEDKCREFLINESVTQYNRMEGTIFAGQKFDMGYRTGSYVEGDDGHMYRDMVKIIEVTVREGLSFNYMHLTRLPIFRPAFLEFFEPSLLNPMDNGFYIPTNDSLDGGDMAKKVFHFFIDKSSHIFRLPYCPCRKAFGSKHRVDLGCIHMGEDTLKIPNPEVRGEFITAEEAKEVLSLAIDDGLIPLLGRAEGEATGFGIKEEGRFLSTCYCSEDACINASICKDASSGAKLNFSRAPGLSLVVDREKCLGCGKCMNICRYRGMEWVDKKPQIVDRCLGCGRCEKACPVGAISFVLEDDLPTITENIIKEIDRIVDVRPTKK